MSETTTVQPTNSITHKLSNSASNGSEQLAEMPDKSAVGWLFVQQYYTFLNEQPHKLHLFYTKESTLCHGIEGQSVTSYHGQSQIIQRIKDHQFNNCKVLISNMDCQESTNGGVVVQVLGEMANNGGPSQKFVQTFFLARQPRGYFVRNDIFRILKEDVEVELENGFQMVAPPVSEPLNEELVSSYSSTASVEPKPINDITATSPSPVPSSTEPIAAPVSSPSAAPPVIEVKIETEETEPAARESSIIEPPSAPAASSSRSVPAVNGTVTPETPQPAPVEQIKPSAPVSWASMAARKKDTETNGHIVTPPSAVHHTTHVTESSAPKPAAAPGNNIIVTTRPGQYPGRPRQEYHSAYIRNVSTKVDDNLLRRGLESIGQLTHFQVEKAKNCAFVDFIDEATLRSALAVHELKVGEHTVLIEERKRGGAKSKNFPKKNGTLNAKNKK